MGVTGLDTAAAADELMGLLAARADPEVAAGLQRYFPHEVPALGVGNAGVVEVARGWLDPRRDLPAAARLALAEEILARSRHHEEVLLGFAVLHKVARTMDDDLLDRAGRWLATYVSNWAQCDDLCLKLLYPYLLGHLDEIPRTRAWVTAESPWGRRAANVAVVKFVRRRIGRSWYELALSHVFDNCARLLHDEDVYVQKGCGWLLKVAGRVHPDEVAGFLRTWHGSMRRDTFRYALEGFDAATRRELLALR